MSIEDTIRQAVSEAVRPLSEKIDELSNKPGYRKRIGRAEARGLLGVNNNTISQYIRKRILTPCAGDKMNQMFYLDDVEDVKKALNK